MEPRHYWCRNSPNDTHCISFLCFRFQGDWGSPHHPLAIHDKPPALPTGGGFASERAANLDCRWPNNVSYRARTSGPSASRSRVQNNNEKRNDGLRGCMWNGRELLQHKLPQRFKHMWAQRAQRPLGPGGRAAKGPICVPEHGHTALWSLYWAARVLRWEVRFSARLLGDLVHLLRQAEPNLWQHEWVPSASQAARPIYNAHLAKFQIEEVVLGKLKCQVARPFTRDRKNPDSSGTRT